MDNEKVYTIKVEGVEEVNNLKGAIDQLNATMKGATESMSGASESAKKMSDSFKNIQGVSNVKELKQSIADLRDQLVNLESGSDAYKATVQDLIQKEMKLKEVMQAGKNEVTAAAGSYNALQREMSVLRKEWKETTDEATRDEIGKKIADLNGQLKEMDASIGNFQRNVGNYKSALDGLDKSYVNQKQELRELKIAMEQLDPSSQEYIDAMNRAAEITHNLKDQQEVLVYSSADIGDQLDNLRGIASNMAAGYSALNAAMGLFGKENEDVKEAMLKVQQAMALVQGLQGLDGFIKRTQGLSNAMKVWINSSKQAATATNATASASAKDAAAKTAQTTATAGATVAQNGLNAAMKANPIGFILGLIMALIAAFALFKDKITELIGGNEKLSNAIDKVKVVMSGIGNVIKKFVIAPIRLAIVPLKTFGKVLYDVFTLNWDEIGKDIKDGANEVVDIVKDTVDVADNYREASHKKEMKLMEEKSKKAAELRKKELDDVIKNNEAKYGSDWKYTENGKKTYDEYFKNLIAMYDKDTDEYKEALRDKEAYEREFNDRINKKREEANKKSLDAFKSAFSNIIPEWTKITINVTDLYDKWVEGAHMFRDELIKTYGFTADVADGIIRQMHDKLTTSIFSDMGKVMVNEYEKVFYNIDRTVEQSINDLTAKFEKSKLDKGVIIPDEVVEHLSEVYKIQADSIKDELNTIDKAINDFYAKLTEIDKNYFTKSFEQVGEEIPEFQKMLDKQNELAAKSTQLQIDMINKVSDAYKTQMENRADLAEKNFEHTQKKDALMAIHSKAQAEMLSETIGFYNDAFYNNSIQQYKSGIAYIDEYYESVKEYYQDMANLYNEYAKNENLTFEERENAKREAAEYTTLITETEVQKQIDSLKHLSEYIKVWKDQFKTVASVASESLGNIADYYYGIVDAEKDKIKTDLENGKIDEEQAEKREAALEDEFEKGKKFQIAQTIINTLSAAMSAYQAMASIPFVGPALGIAAAAAALATGYAQVEQIKATSFDNSYSGSKSIDNNGSGSSTFQLPDVEQYEPSYYQNTTGATDIDNPNGNGMKDIRVVLVESDVTIAQNRAKKVDVESTF